MMMMLSCRARMHRIASHRIALLCSQLVNLLVMMIDLDSCLFRELDQ